MLIYILIIYLNNNYSFFIIGIYSPISKLYSNDLAMVVACLLKVDQNVRPSCDQILSLQSVRKYMDSSQKSTMYSEKSDLIDTIKVPQNIKDINNKLPKIKNYIDYDCKENAYEYGTKPKIVDFCELSMYFRTLCKERI